MRTDRSRSNTPSSDAFYGGLLGSMAAGLLFALTMVPSFAGPNTTSVLPAWAVFPAQLAWPDRPEFPSQGLWPDDPRYGTSNSQISNSRSLRSIFDLDYVSAFKTATTSNAGTLKVVMEAEFRDSTKTDGRSFLGFSFGDNSKWQENQVGYTNMKMHLGDSIRVNTKFGASQYEASQAFFMSMRDKKSPEDTRDARFAAVGSGWGTASLTRMEEDVLRLGNGTLTLFQEFIRVDPFFEDIKFSDKALSQQTKDDPFSKPDRMTARYGASFVQGPWGFTVSRSSISNISDTVGQFYREERDSSKFWFSPRDLYKGDSSDTILSKFLPSSVWIGYEQSSVRQNTLEFPEAAVTNINAGGFWQLNQIYASLSFWRVSSESAPQQLNRVPIYWRSDGANFGAGIQNKTWKFYGYVGISRSNYDDGWSKTNNNNLNGGISLSMTVEGSPDIILAFDVGNYGGQYDYTSLSGLDGGRYSKAGLALDFSKYLTDSAKQKLKLFYYAQKDTFDSRWPATASQSSSLDHVFGASMKSLW
jgi:hypothetical protein